MTKRKEKTIENGRSLDEETGKEFTGREWVQHKLNEIYDIMEGGEFVFRGENKDYGLVCSGLYRQYVELIADVQQQSEPQKVPVSMAMQEIAEQARGHVREGAVDAEVLTELQHYGGKTALIDFTTNLFVALYFSCCSELEENGRLILVDKKDLDLSGEIQYMREPDNEVKQTPTLILSTGKSPRVIFQGSVFIYAQEGFLRPKYYKTIFIESKRKKVLLDYLREKAGISAETIYNDLHGFIRNQKDLSSAYKYFFLGCSYQENGKYEKAIQQYNEALKINPRFAGAYHNRGAAKDQLEDYNEALEDYSKALVINPKLAMAYNNRGFIKQKLGNHKESLEDYDRALEINSKYAAAYYNRGNAKKNLGNLKGALIDYDRTLEINSKYVHGYNNRGNVKQDLEDFKDALEDYDKALEIDPKYVFAYHNRGETLQKMKNFRGARQEMLKALSLYKEQGNKEGEKAVMKLLDSLDKK